MTDAERVVETLRGGGIVLLPTDTVYGLAVHPVHGAGALARLFAMKRRPLSRNLPIMVASPDQAEELGARRDRRRPGGCWPRSRPGRSRWPSGSTRTAAPDWLAGRDEIAVRIPDDALLLEVLRTAGPLLVTSANLHAPGDAGVDAAGAGPARRRARPGAGRRGAGDRPVHAGELQPADPAVERVGAVPADQIAKVLA